MVKTLFESGYSPGAVTTANTTQYAFIIGSHTYYDASDSPSQSIFHLAGTLSGLYVKLVANSIAATSTIRTRLNAANGGQSVSVGSSATGAFEDTTGTDTIVDTDKVCMQTVPGAATGTMSICLFSTLFDATTNTVTKFSVNIGNSGASATYFMTPNGDHVANTTELNAKVRMRKAGTFKKGSVNVITARATTSTIKSRKNGANGGISISLTGGTTGWFEDSTGTDTIAVDDDWNWTSINGTGTDVPAWRGQVDFESTAGDGLCLISRSDAVALADATGQFWTIDGRLALNSTEANRGTKARVAFVCSELITRVTQNDISAASTVTLRVNSADSVVTLSITGSTTGVFADSTHSVTLATTDVLTYGVVPTSVGGAHTLTLAWVAMTTHLDAALTRVSLSRIYQNKIQAQVSLSRIYKNKIVGRVSLSRIYKNKIGARISLVRIYKNKIRARVSLSRIYKNKIVGRISLSRIYKNKIGQRISLSRIYKNRILTKVSLTRIYKNKIVGRVSLSRIYKNKIAGRISLSRVYKNKIQARVSLSRVYKNRILTRVTLSRIYKNKIQARVSLSRVYKNKILQRASLTRIYKNRILTRVSLSRVYKNKIFQRISLTRIYKNKIAVRVSLSRIYKNKIVARVSLTRIYKNQILVTGLTRISLQRIYVNKIQARVSLNRTYKNKILQRISLSRIYKNKIAARVSLSRIYKNKIVGRVSLTRVYKNKILQRVQEIFYNLAIPGNTSAALQTGASIRYGVLFGASSSFIGKSISSWTVGLFKSGTPSGNITAAVYDNANTVVSTFNETIDSTTLPTSTAVYKFNLSIPRTIVANDRLVILYGGAAAVNISIYNTDQIDGSNTLRTRWGGSSWINGTTEDVAGLIAGPGLQQTYKNRILQRVPLTRIYKNKISARVSLSRIYKNRIFLRVSLTRIYKNRILIRVSLPRIYKNKIQARVSLSRIYKNQILTLLQRISLTRIYKNRILVTAPPIVGGGGPTTAKKRNRFRAWIAGWAKDTRELFRIKSPPPPPEDVEIPEAQPPKIFHILPSPPTMETKLQTLNDKWSVVASTLAQPPEVRTEIIYPVIINPDLIPLTQTRVTFPESKPMKQTITPTYRVADGIHMHSDVVGTPKPKNRSKVASTINTLMILLEIERQI